MIYCLSLHRDQILWNRLIPPDVDRLSISPDGRLLYVPTWEGNTFDFINVLDAASGDVTRQVHFPNASHDAEFPLSGPLFQETKARDGSGRYLYLIDPASYTISRIGPFAGILGPYAVNGRSTYVANNVTDLWGMQIADIKTGRIITANIPDHPPGEPGLAHGIAWRPDEKEVWQSSGARDPRIIVWDMSTPDGSQYFPVLSTQSAQLGRHRIIDPLSTSMATMPTPPQVRTASKRLKYSTR